MLWRELEFRWEGVLSCAFRKLLRAQNHGLLSRTSDDT